MKKLSKLDESIWADIHKRSNGSKIRKEDDIELLDMTGLYDYILAHYELTDKSREMTYGTHNMSIVISSDGDEILLLYGFHEVHLYFNLPKYKLLETELRKKFSVSPVGLDIDYYTVEQSGKPTNQFFIDVLDCIIANRDTILRKKDNVSESVWADIHKRSNGMKDRKENDIDLFDSEELCDYLNKTYITITPYDIIADDNSDGISICLYTINGNRYSYLQFCGFSKDKKNICLTDLYNRHMRETLNKAFKVTEHTVFTDDDDYYLIESYDNREITNSFFIEVLDFLLNSADSLHKPRLKKKVTESIWADIHKRSNGTKERKEDDPNLLDAWGFIKYLKKRYNYTSDTFDFDKETGDGLDVSIMSGNRTYYLGLSNINDDIYMTLSTHHSLSIEMKYNSKLYSELSKNFGTQYDNDAFLGEHIFIYPKDESDVDFKFFVTVLDFFIDNIDNVKNISRK